MNTNLEQMNKEQLINSPKIVLINKLIQLQGDNNVLTENN